MLIIFGMFILKGKNKKTVVKMDGCHLMRGGGNLLPSFYKRLKQYVRIGWSRFTHLGCLYLFMSIDDKGSAFKGTRDRQKSSSYLKESKI